MTRQSKAQLEARIAKLEAEVARLSELAMRDPLTGAYNRQAFDEHLSRELAAAKRGPNHPVGLLMIDLNDFKAVNDICGHEVGDGALKLVVEVVQACVRETDIVCRYGGDEIVVILHTPIDIVGIQKVGERVVEVLNSRNVETQNRPIHVKVSIGGAIAVDDGGLGLLLKRADQACYRAKELKSDGLSHVAI